MSYSVRPDALEKLTGQVLYGVDVERPGMWWGALVPSPAAAGRLVAIDASAVADEEAVVVTAADLPRLLPNGSGDPERPIFPSTAVRYRGEPVAAVAAPTLERARAAAARVRVRLDAEAPVEDLDRLFPDWPSPETMRDHPLVNGHVLARFGPVDRAFRTADELFQETYRTSGVHQVPLEPHACVADATGSVWHVTTSTQTPFGCREDTASLLGIPESSLVVEGSWVGGAFGSKGSALLEPYALVLSRASGRPVRLALSYAEEFQLGRTTLPSVLRLETALRNGRVVGRRARLLLDTGASLPGGDFTLGYAAGFLLGPYGAPALEIEGYAIRTHKPPFGPHRAPFIPQVAFAIESHLTHLAAHLGEDPIRLRRATVWTEGQTTTLGQRVGPFGLDRCLERAAEVVRAWRVDLPAGHGVGTGAGFWSTGAGAGGEARVVLTPTAVEVEQSEREIGSGSVLRGVAAVVERVLGLPPSHVVVRYQDTASGPFDSGVFGSRTVAALGQAAEKASRRLLTVLQERAGLRSTPRLAVADGRIVLEAPGTSAPVETLFTDSERRAGRLVVDGRHYGRAEGGIDPSRAVVGEFHPFTDFTAAAHVAEVEVDRELGAVRVVRYHAIHDVGTLIDRRTATAQVEGGVAMGLGEALTEEMLWRDDGRLENPGLLDYRLMTITDVPPIEVEFVEGFRGAGPFGAKGLGEIPIVPVPATIAAAIHDALGRPLFELPMTPERIARALAERTVDRPPVGRGAPA